MKPESFCYWLQGYFEMQDPHEIGINQTKMIRDHLNLVFDKNTPERPVKSDNFIHGLAHDWSGHNSLKALPESFFRPGDSVKPYC